MVVATPLTTGVVRDQRLGVAMADPVFGILGRTALLMDGTLREDWGWPKERALLGALLVHAGRRVSVDTLLDWAWPEETALPRNRGPTFHHYAARIRKALQRLPVPTRLDPGRGGYLLDVDRTLVDYHRFIAQLAEANARLRTGEPLAAVDLVSRALGLWRARPLDDLGGEPAEAWRIRVRDEWLTANATLLDALIALERFDEVLLRLGDLQTDHPHDVTLMTQRLSALHGLGRYSDEIAYFLKSRRRLQHDGDDQAALHLQRHHNQLIETGVRVEARPATLPVVVPHQLHHDIPDFVGRADLLAELDAATTDRSGQMVSGVVVIDGMAGVGKTSLAVHWAHGVRARFPGGDLYADLHGYSDSTVVSPSAVVDDFLTALGQLPGGNVTARARELMLKRLLTDRRTLVVLDNARDTEHVRGLVSLLPGALVLVTSRQRLSTLSRITGARRVGVEPMRAAEAETLLATRVGSRRQMSEADRTRLAAMCAGLPLVLSLLAEHIATRPPGQVARFAERLDTHQLLHDIGEDGDGPANARTFFAWSYRAREEPERRLFRLLGQLPGEDFSLDVAAACDGRSTAETTRSLRLLVSAHMLEQPVALDRFRFHDLIRAYAVDCAESDESEAERTAAVRRSIAFYLRSAAGANGILYPSRMSPADLHDDVDAVELCDPEQAESWFERERKCLVAAVRLAAREHPDHCWRLADLLGTFLDRHGYHVDARVVREFAADSANLAGDREGEASSLNNLGKVYLDLGEHAKARNSLTAALRLVEDDGHEIGQAAVLGMLGRLEMQSGDPAAALGLYRRSLEIAQRIGDERDMAWTSRRMGEVLRVLQRPDEALVLLHEAQWMARRIGDRSAHASSLAEMGLVHRDKGDLPAAAAHCEEALRLAEPIPDLAVVALAYTALAEIELSRNTSAAFAFAYRAIELCRRTSNLSLEARAHEVHGDLLQISGEVAGAARAWTRAIDLYERIGSPTRAGDTRRKLGKL